MGKNTIFKVVTGVTLFIFSLSLSAQMHVDATGNVGIGTDVPAKILHVKDVDKAILLVENTTSGAAKLNLRNANGEWIFNARNTVLRVTSGAPLPEFLLSQGTGDLTILGELTTGGTTCGGGGCDLVFSPETEIESIEEHAAQMWENSYLPSVGPTKENAPINLSQKTGGILNELEKAHIYIEQLHNRLAEVESSQNVNALEARLAQLENENRELKNSYTQVLAQQQQQANDFDKLKSMMVDLHVRVQSQDLLTSIDQ